MSKWKDYFDRFIHIRPELNPEELYQAFKARLAEESEPCKTQTRIGKFIDMQTQLAEMGIPLDARDFMEYLLEGLEK